MLLLLLLLLLNNLILTSATTLLHYLFTNSCAQLGKLTNLHWVLNILRNRERPALKIIQHPVKMAGMGKKVLCGARPSFASPEGLLTDCLRRRPGPPGLVGLRPSALRSGAFGPRRQSSEQGAKCESIVVLVDNKLSNNNKNSYFFIPGNKFLRLMFISEYYFY